MTEELIPEEESTDESTPILLTMVFTIIIIIVAYGYQNWDVMAKIERFLPNASCNILLGMVIGAFISLEEDVERRFSFHEDFFFLVMLPPIIFASGFNLRKDPFFYNFGTIVLYAFIGTAIATLVIALFLNYLSKYTYELKPNECLIFASLISAIDPVATIVTMQSSGVSNRLFALIFGEAVLNDAVAIVINDVFLQVAEEDKDIESELLIAVPEIIGISIASVLIGVIIALGSSYLYKKSNLKENHVLEVTLFFILGIIPYMICENIHLSGIMAILFSGIFFNYYTYCHLSSKGQIAVNIIVHMMEFVSEAFIFFFLGSALWRSNNKWHFGLFFLTIVACIVGRGVSVWLITWLANGYLRKHIITRQEILMMWFSGLRGPVSFALAFRISRKAMPDDNDRNTIITTTLLIIWVTSFLMGGMSNDILKWLKLIPSEITLYQIDGPEEIAKEKTLDESNHWFNKLNKDYLKKTFGAERRESETGHDASISARDSDLPSGRKRNISVIKGGSVSVNNKSFEVEDMPQTPLQGSCPLQPIELKKVRNLLDEANFARPRRSDSECDIFIR